jgi:hypothetical protein
MVINFKVHEISRDAYKLIRIFMIIIKKNNVILEVDNKIKLYFFFHLNCQILSE